MSEDASRPTMEHERIYVHCQDSPITIYSPILGLETPMTVAVAHSSTARGKAALRSAAAEALLRDEPLAVLRIIPGVDKPGTQDPALIEQLTDELADFSDLTWKLHTGPD